MPILTASQDNLLADPLRDDPLKEEYDSVGVLESNRIRTYDKEMGMAMHPEEREAALGFKGRVDAEVGRQTGVLNTYKSDFAERLKKADEEARAAMAKAQASRPHVSAPSQQKVRVNVASHGTHEGSYLVNKEWADQVMPKAGASSQDGQYNVDVRGYGKEMHEALIRAQNQTNNADRDINSQVASAQAASDKAFDTQIQGLQEQLDSSRNIALNEYNQNVSLSEQKIAETQRLWTDWLSRGQQAFAQGVQNNTRGIADLVASGALEFKGVVK